MREISYKGKSYKSLTDLAVELKTSPANLSYRLKKYGGFEIKKEKKIKDHLGNAFETEKKMCEFYQISYKTYNARKRYGWDLKKILTTKTRDYNYKNWLKIRVVSQNLLNNTLHFKNSIYNYK